MRTRASKTRWIVSGLMAAALTLAPVTALGCPPGMTTDQSARMDMGAMVSAPSDTAATQQPDGKPCDTPCKDCSSSTAKKTCMAACVCAPALMAIEPVSPLMGDVAATVAPHLYSAPVALARPPDTPPPRSLA